jgi:hypothetical protein
MNLCFAPTPCEKELLEDCEEEGSAPPSLQPTTPKGVESAPNLSERGGDGQQKTAMVPLDGRQMELSPQSTASSA